MGFVHDFITSALVIDDSKEEVEKLIEFLEEEDIWVKHYTPDDLDNRTKALKNRRLIFLDLYLDDSRKSVENIALIRKYFKTIVGSDFGAYGIILWTKHTSHFKEFCNKIYNENNPFTKPLFIVPLEKTKYFNKGSYNGVLDDLEEKLENDVSSSFFIEWNKAVKKGSDKTISNLYGLFDTNENKDKYLETVLFNLACNLTGIQTDNIEGYDLQKDLVKSLMDSLQVEISNNYNNIKELFSEPNKLVYEAGEDKTKVFSKLNSLLLLDFSNLSDTVALPGNIYEVIEEDNPLYFNNFYRKNNEIKVNEHKDFKCETETDTDKNTQEVSTIKRVVIELTPPCDFAGRKKQLQSRLIGGIMLDYDIKLKEKYFNGNGFYSFIHPIFIKGCKNPQMIIFDFYKFQTVNENDLKDKGKYKIFARAKDKLFADILQKLSSHTARLGVAILSP